MYSPGSVAGMRQGKVSRAQAVKCPENTQGISKGVTTFHPYETCEKKEKKKISLFAWCGYSPFFIPFSYREI